MTTQTTLSEAAESLALALDCPHYKDVIEVHLKKWGNGKIVASKGIANKHGCSDECNNDILCLMDFL